MQICKYHHLFKHTVPFSLDVPLLFDCQSRKWLSLDLLKGFIDSYIATCWPGMLQTSVQSGNWSFVAACWLFEMISMIKNGMLFQICTCTSSLELQQRFWSRDGQTLSCIQQIESLLSDHHSMGASAVLQVWSLERRLISVSLCSVRQHKLLRSLITHAQTCSREPLTWTPVTWSDLTSLWNSPAAVISKPNQTRRTTSAPPAVLECRADRVNTGNF